MDQPPHEVPLLSPRALGQFFLPVAATHLALTGAILLSWGESLHHHPLFPGSVATVHLYVLGVLTMALIGIALGHLPLWTGIPLPWPGLNPWIRGSLALGALTVFLGVGTNLHPWMLLVASAGVGVACTFFLLQAGVMLFRTTRRNRMIALLWLSWSALLGVFVLGGIFLGEYSHGFLAAYDRFAMVGTHLTWGVFGWAGALLLVMRLTGMQDSVPPIPLWTVIGGWLSMLLVPLALFYPGLDPRWLWPAALPGLAALVALTRISWSHSTRPINPYWRAADLFGAVALLVLMIWPVWPDERWRFLFGLLMLPGWSLSQLFGAYEQMQPGRLELPHMIAHLSSVLLPVAGLFLPWEGSWRAGGGMMVISAALLLTGGRKGRNIR
ncbi:MAG: hypothetical protein HQL91_09925 [Magnetococcales bacterium]|nr:hypothetical protein [Magnetococcales bacterium]